MQYDSKVLFERWDHGFVLYLGHLCYLFFSVVSIFAFSWTEQFCTKNCLIADLLVWLLFRLSLLCKSVQRNYKVLGIAAGHDLFNPLNVLVINQLILIFIVLIDFAESLWVRLCPVNLSLPLNYIKTGFHKTAFLY